MSEAGNERLALAGPNADGALAALLRRRGITPTAQRLQVAAILLARPQHLSAEQILRKVRAQGPGVSKATVYNTLGLFARRGLVREVVVDATKTFYDSNTADHYHFYDVSTGSLTDIDREQIAIGGLPELALPGDAVVEGVDVIVRVRSRSR